MKHYLTNNEIRAIEEGQEFLVQSDWVLLSYEELQVRLNPPKTEEQILAEKIAEAKAYLLATDYVTAKYNDEVTVAGSMTKTAFLAKYADVYAQRAEARAIVSGGE